MGSTIRIVVITVPLHFHDTVRDIVNLLLQQPLLPFLRDGNPFKLAVNEPLGFHICFCVQISPFIATSVRLD